jgi:hypothetical protein
MTNEDKNEDWQNTLGNNEACARCGVLGHDRRTLWMACFYAMNELAIPFEQLSLFGIVLQPTGNTTRWGVPEFEEPPYDSEERTKRTTHHVMFTLRVCKGCRSEWMNAVKTWFRALPSNNSRWNNDGTDYLPNDTLPAILAELEKLRVESVAIEQRIGVFMSAAKEEEARREAEDRRT